MDYSKLARAGLSVLVFVLAFALAVADESLPTAVLLGAYGVVFGVVAVEPTEIDRQTVRRVGYAVAGLGGLGLYVVGIRNDIVVMSLVLGAGGLAGLLLGWRGATRPSGG